MAVLGGLTALGAASTDMYAPAFPALREHFHSSTAAIQVSVAAFLVTLACGQLLFGSLSDVLGRRPLLLVGGLTYLAASLLCAGAPQVGVLIGGRALQGFGAAAGIVIGRAAVQDGAQGHLATRSFSRLATISGLAPILAPSVGAVVLHVAGWRAIFLTQAIIGAVLLAAAWRYVPESLRHGERSAPGPVAALTAYARVLRLSQFRRCAIAFALAAGVVFGYVSTYAFVVETRYGGSPLLFAALFGLNGAGMVATAATNPRLVGRLGVLRVLRSGLLVSTVAAISLVAAVLNQLPLVLVALLTWVVIATRGTILPNLTSVAMSAVPSGRGVASAVLGAVQWLVGGLAAVIVSAISDPGTAMSLVMATFSALSLVAAVAVVRHDGPAPSPEAAEPPADGIVEQL